VRTAVVHDWLTGMRGGELVLEQILDLVPDPTLFTLFHFRGSVSPRIERVPIVTSFLQRLPLGPGNYRRFLPLFPSAVESFDLSGFDRVVSSSHCVAKGVRPAGAPHLCYCHTPVRYAYDQFDAYFPRETTRFFAVKKRLIGRLRDWDIRVSPRVTRFLANSTRVAERIRRAYGREARVLHPPVDVDFFTPGPPGGGYGQSEAGEFALCVGSLAPYKRFDRAVEWANRTGHPLRIVGKGPEEKRLRAMAGSSVQFESDLPREELRERYRRCAFYLQPGEEDFGIASVEAQACGKPVIAFGRGGIRDVLAAPGTGVLYEESSAGGIARAIDTLRRLGSNGVEARRNAERFSTQRFRSGFSEVFREMNDA
jgi:glycosyltransferase involved in cell wall biosynthesis